MPLMPLIPLIPLVVQIGRVWIIYNLENALGSCLFVVHPCIYWDSL